MSSYKHAIAAAFEVLKAKYHEPKATIKSVIDPFSPEANRYEIEGSRLSPFIMVGDYATLQVLHALRMGYHFGYNDGHGETQDLNRLNREALDACCDE